MFQGFMPETFDFLWGIRLNNNRDWFLAHKGEYLKYLYEPLRELGGELYEPFRDVPGMNLHVARIYRDTRLHHPDPYKEDLWCSIRRESPFWSEHPSLYFDVSPEGVSYGFTLWRPKPAAMEAFRRGLDRDPEPFRRLLAQTEKRLGVPVTAESYKRPKPCENPNMGPWYHWKSDIGVSLSEDVGENLFTPELKDRVSAALQTMLPLHEYFQKFTG